MNMTESIPVTEASPVAVTAETKTVLDIHDILKILPHRYPFLLIDRVLDLKRKDRIVAIKNVTFNGAIFCRAFSGAADHAGGADRGGDRASGRRVAADRGGRPQRQDY